MLEWENLLRIANAIGCLVALWILSVSAYRQWSSWTDKTRNHWWALSGWVFIGMEAAIENVVLQTEPGPRVILQALVVAFTLRALLDRGELKAESELPWKRKE